jgi:hypothetical protein|tara:strand:+ start:313 stop:567 length:255 start_codon:yes stop_codon:yes gene_type:complete
MVSTAGFEKPEIACSGVKYPNKNKIERRIMAVTSIEKISVTNRINPKASKPITIAISGVIEANLIQEIEENNLGINQLKGCSPT